uniref:RasGEF domain containing protein n=1 Tax=Globodera pallida TaxID=36090 RepID=A0A183BT96_GLOPA
MTASKYWGEERHADAVYAVMLKKVRYVPPSDYEGVPPIEQHPADISAVADSVDHLQWETIRERVIKAGTVPKLVESLIDTDGQMDSRQFNVFFATYRAFSNAAEVFRLITDQYTKNDRTVGEAQEEIRSSLRAILMCWLEMYPEDFYEQKQQQQQQQPSSSATRQGQQNAPGAFDKNASSDQRAAPQNAFRFPTLEALIDFARARALHDLKQKGKRVRERLRRMAHNGGLSSQLPSIGRYSFAITGYDPAAPSSSSSSSMPSSSAHSGALVDEDERYARALASAQERAQMFDPGTDNVPQIAEQLTFWDAVFFRELRPYQCQASGGWKNSSIFELDEEDNSGKQRARHILETEGTAKVSPAKIGGGTTNGGAGGEAFRRTKSDLNLTMVDGGVEQHHQQQGTVPWLGTFLTDLEKLDQLYPDLTPEGLFNFEKRRKEFEVLAEIRLFQSAARSYTLQLDQAFCVWFHFLPALNEKECFARSLELEPLMNHHQHSAPTPEEAAAVVVRRRGVRDGLYIHSLGRFFSVLSSGGSKDLDNQQQQQQQFSPEGIGVISPQQQLQINGVRRGSVCGMDNSVGMDLVDSYCCSSSSVGGGGVVGFGVSSPEKPPRGSGGVISGGGVTTTAAGALGSGGGGGRSQSQGAKKTHRAAARRPSAGGGAAARRGNASPSPARSVAAGGSVPPSCHPHHQQQQSTSKTASSAQCGSEFNAQQQLFPSSARFAGGGRPAATSATTSASSACHNGAAGGGGVEFGRQNCGGSTPLSSTSDPVPTTAYFGVTASDFARQQISSSSPGSSFNSSAGRFTAAAPTPPPKCRHQHKNNYSTGGMMMSPLTSMGVEQQNGLRRSHNESTGSSAGGVGLRRIQQFSQKSVSSTSSRSSMGAVSSGGSKMFGGASPSSISVSNCPREEQNFHLVRVGLDDTLQGELNAATINYKCIKVVNGDRMPQLIERALDKHLLDPSDSSNYCLVQLLPDGSEFLFPDHCNPFYAVAPDPSSPMLACVLRKRSPDNMAAVLNCSSGSTRSSIAQQLHNNSGGTASSSALVKKLNKQKRNNFRGLFCETAAGHA